MIEGVEVESNAKARKCPQPLSHPEKIAKTTAESKARSGDPSPKAFDTGSTCYQKYNDQRRVASRPLARKAHTVGSSSCRKAAFESYLPESLSPASINTTPGVRFRGSFFFSVIFVQKESNYLFCNPNWRNQFGENLTLLYLCNLT